jgi:hypothetical protein
MRKLGNGGAKETEVEHDEGGLPCRQMAVEGEELQTRGYGLLIGALGQKRGNRSAPRQWCERHHACGQWMRSTGDTEWAAVAAATKGALVGPGACPNVAFLWTKNAWLQSAARRDKGPRGGSGNHGHAVGEARVGWVGDTVLRPERTGRGCPRAQDTSGNGRQD